MAEVIPDRINTIKARVKAECLRRCYSGSVASYGSSTYDFSVTPDADIIAMSEHAAKNLVPLNAINAKQFPSTTGGRVVSDAELTAQEAFLTIAERTAIRNTAKTDCGSGCTGLCYGCTGSCTGGCSGCGGSCSYSCSGCDGCSGCGSGCASGCYGCGSGCASTCTGCTGCSGCSSSCGFDGCVGACVSSCSAGCTTGCGSSCGSCSGNCTRVSA